jgi:hypothetical protein
VWRDVQNSSASSSSGFGVGFGVHLGSAETEAGKNVAARYPGTLTPIVNMPAREGDEGTTRATVTPGTLELSDQRQDLASLNRDAGAAHVSVEAYDIARLKARQEGAAALSELLNGLTGDLSAEIGLKDGGPAKAALHAAVGAAVAAVAGTDIGTGAAAGLVSELANGVVSQMLKDHPELTKAQQDAIRQWTATALGAAIGGQAGAAAALDNIKHNYLKHEEALERANARRACEEGDAATCKRVAELDQLDQSRDDALTAACLSPSSKACGAAVEEAFSALLSFQAASSGRYATQAEYLQAIGEAAGPELAAEYAQNLEVLRVLGEIPGVKQTISRLLHAQYAEDHGLIMRTVIGFSSAGADTIRSMHGLVDTLTNEPGQLADVAQAIIDDPSLIPAGIWAPVQERFDAGDIAGGVGYLLFAIADAAGGVKGVSKIITVPKTADEVVDALRNVRNANRNSDEIAQIVLNRQNGVAFERQVIDAFSHVGGEKNTVLLPITLPNGVKVTTIPDMWGRNVGGLLEVKNVQNLSMSNQLRAQVRLAIETNQPLNIVVSPRTTNVSRQVTEQVTRTGGNIYMYDPATGDLTRF